MPERSGVWREIRVGVATAVALGLVLVVIWIQRGGNPFAEVYQIQFFVEDARGLQEGAAVSLSGVPVGEVTRVDVLGGAPALRARYPDQLRDMNIRVVLQVDERYRDEITDRSQVRLASQGASGGRFVSIEKGPVGGTPLPNGARIGVTPSLDVEFLLARGTEVLNRVAEFNRRAERVGELVTSGTGTLGRFLADPADNEVSENLEEMNARAREVLASLEGGQGIIAQERRTGRIRENVTAFLASLDSIERGVREGQGSLSPLVSDGALLDALGRLQARAAAVSAKLERGDGSLGRFVNDPELFQQLELLTIGLDSLVTRVKGDPLGAVNVDVF